MVVAARKIVFRAFAGLPASGVAAYAAMAERSDRVVMFDAIRIIATLAVIYFHSIESETLRASGVIGRFSVAFYTLAAMIFMVRGIRRHPERGLWDYATMRFRRLYLPFLGWSLITAGSLMLLHLFDSGTAVPAIEVDSLVTGLAPQLWFIPFILVGGIALFPLTKLTLGERRWELLLACAAGIVALSLDWIPWNDPPLQQLPLVGKLLALSWHRWSALYWGLTLAILYTRWLRGTKLSGWMACGGLGLLLVTTAYQWIYGIVPALKVCGGLGVCLLAFAPWKHVLISKLGQLAPLSFGMYMSHTLWIGTARTLANYYGLPTCWQRDVLVFLLAVLASLLTVRILATSPMFEWLTGKESGSEIAPARGTPARARPRLAA
ncbi:MAG: acyltransferase family protein [Phycisphaerae bacterium]